MESKDWSGFGYFSPDLEKIKQLVVCSKHQNTWEDTGNEVKVFFSIQSEKKECEAAKEDWVFNAICRKSCHQLVLKLTKIYLEGINFLLPRNSWIFKLWNDVRWIMKLEFESIGKLCQLVSWADQALTRFDSFEVLSGCKNRDKNSSGHNLSFDFVKRILVLSAIADSPDRHLRTNF